MNPLMATGALPGLTTCSSIAVGGRGVSATSSARDQAEELSNWKLNCPFLYDYIATHVLVWPSLSVEILPVEAFGDIAGSVE